MSCSVSFGLPLLEVSDLRKDSLCHRFRTERLENTRSRVMEAGRTVRMATTMAKAPLDLEE